jgi:excisionase family DNA binding protein
MAKLNALTPEMRAFFEDYYTLRTKSAFARMFNKRFGLNISASALKEWARSIGLAGEKPPGFMTLAELSSITGDPPTTILRLIKSGHLKATKPGGYWLVPLSAAHKYIQSREQPDWHWVTVTEANRRLGYSRGTLAERIRHGSIPGKLLPVNGMQQWVVPAKLIDIAHQHIRVTGNNRVPWEQLTAEWSKRYHVDI